jgi:hypothetical protein
MMVARCKETSSSVLNDRFRPAIDNYNIEKVYFSHYCSIWSGAGAGNSPAPNQIAALRKLNRRFDAKIFFSSVTPDWLSICR